MNAIRREGEQIVIRLDAADAHSLQVALSPCPCRATKSNGTQEIRERLATGLARAVSQKTG